MRRDCRQIVGIMIHVMAVTGLARTTMAAAVVGDDAKAVVDEKHHLRVPIISRQRPAVTENNGLTFAPVLVINSRPVFRRNRWHKYSSKLDSASFRKWPTEESCGRGT